MVQDAKCELRIGESDHERARTRRAGRDQSLVPRGIAVDHPLSPAAAARERARSMSSAMTSIFSCSSRWVSRWPVRP